MSKSLNLPICSWQGISRLVIGQVLAFANILFVDTGYVQGFLPSCTLFSTPPVNKDEKEKVLYHSIFQNCLFACLIIWYLSTVSVVVLHRMLPCPRSVRWDGWGTSSCTSMKHYKQLMDEGTNTLLDITYVRIL